jgi:hypothetical protein
MHRDIALPQVVASPLVCSTSGGLSRAKRRAVETIRLSELNIEDVPDAALALPFLDLFLLACRPLVKTESCFAFCHFFPLGIISEIISG